MKLECHSEKWPLARTFTISHGSTSEAKVVVVTLTGEGARGRGESVPTRYYGESVPQILEILEKAAALLDDGATIEEAINSLPVGAARNALDCAWWDWRCKREGKRITELAGLPPLASVTTAYTIGIDTPEVMSQIAREHSYRPLLKIKTGTDNVVESVRAIREGAPNSRLIVDANEGWPENRVSEYLEALAGLGVAMIEQPLPAGKDDMLAGLKRPIPIYADEAIHVAADVAHCVGKYDGVNIKLDKTGGFSEALRTRAAAKQHNLGLMFGCMVGTSLSMAPLMALAQGADFVDLDAPLLLAGDRPEGIRYEQSTMMPYGAELWG